MPIQKYQCKNVAGGCENAITHGIIEVEEGTEFECPGKLAGCEAKEIEVEVKPPVPWKKIAMGAGAVAVLGAGVAMFVHKTPDRDAADQMLTDTFPGLRQQ